MVLLFKKPPAIEIPHWRPISLLNVSYKLMTMEKFWYSQELQDHVVQLRQLRVLKDSTRITETEQTYTATVQKMMAPGMGRHLLHHVLWQTSGVFSLDDRTAKKMLQCLTSTYPTMGQLHVMGKAATAACPFYFEETETLGHWQQDSNSHSLLMRAPRCMMMFGQQYTSQFFVICLRVLKVTRKPPLV